MGEKYPDRPPPCHSDIGCRKCYGWGCNAEVPSGLEREWPPCLVCCATGREPIPMSELEQ
jgi:hypothetical protein